MTGQWLCSDYWQQPAEQWLSCQLQCSHRSAGVLLCMLKGDALFRGLTKILTPARRMIVWHIGPRWKCTVGYVKMIFRDEKVVCMFSFKTTRDPSTHPKRCLRDIRSLGILRSLNRCVPCGFILCDFSIAATTCRSSSAGSWLPYQPPIHHCQDSRHSNFVSAD